jgi:hypothetical protein
MRLAGELLVRPDKVFYFGPIIGGPEAIYAFPKEVRSAQAIGMAAGGGALGSVLGAARDRNAHALQSIEADLPHAVTADPDWPREDTGDRRRALVFSKAKVTKLRYPWWGALTFDMGARRFTVQASMFRRATILRFLRGAGWDV